MDKESPSRAAVWWERAVERGSDANSVILGITLVAFAAWSLSFIWDTSFEIDGERTFCLFDDAMITMTYARNVVEGHGLNWARWGDPVEGYTHPLWLVPMVLVSALGASRSVAPLFIQLLSFVVLFANVVAVYRLCRRHAAVDGVSHAWLAAILTAAFYPLNYWSLMGMETGLQVLLMVLAVTWAMDIVVLRRDRVVPLFAACSLAALLRPDMLIFVVVTLAYVVARGGYRAEEKRQWIRGAIVLFGPLVAYELARLAYFGHPLPNTYYLKMTGAPPLARVLRGIRVTEEIVEPSAYAFGLIAVASGIAIRWRPRMALPLALFLAYFAYSIWIGGDAWEGPRIGWNRFQAPVMPFAFVLLVAGLDRAVAVAGKWPLRRLRTMGPLFAAVLGILMFRQIHALDTDEENRGPLAWQHLTLETRPEGVGGFYRHIADAQELNRTLPADTRLAVVWLGIFAYHTDFEVVDVLGYNDEALAHGPNHETWDGSADDYFFPGHMKWNLALTLERRRPDMFVHTWRLDAEDTRLLESRGYVRRGLAWMTQRVADATD